MPGRGEAVRGDVVGHPVAGFARAERAAQVARDVAFVDRRADAGVLP